MSFQGILGHVSKKDFINYLFKKIDKAFSMDIWDSNNTFYKTYGIKGSYYSDLDEDIQSSGLVIIQGCDLTKLVASKQLAEYYADDEGYNDETIDIKAKEISKQHMLNTGLSEKDIQFFEDLSSK